MGIATLALAVASFRYAVSECLRRLWGSEEDTTLETVLRQEDRDELQNEERFQ